MKLSIKNLAIVGAVIAAIAGGIWLAKPSEASVCDGWINVITCGTPSHQDLKNVYYGRNDIKALYQWNNINDAMIEGKGMKNGTVYKDGRIVVDGQVVATNAKTVQRNTRYPGSSYGRETVGGHSFYKFTTQNSFVYNQFEAFVWFDDNGKFIAAIIKDCGNPVWGDATPPPAKPSLTCDALQKTEVSRNTFKFSTKATAKDGASVTSYTYDFGDGTTQTTTSSEIQHTYAKPGNYKVTVTVNGKEGSDVQKTSQGCQTQITVKPEPEMQVCRLSDKKYPVTIKESEFDEKKYSKNPNDCKEVPEELEVCILESKEIKKIKKEEFNESKHTTDLSRCKETPEEIEICVIETKQIKRIKKEELNKEIHTTDLSKCKEKPVTPPETPSTPPKTPETPTPGELPKTGTANIVMSALGLGGLTTAIIAYVASRRQM